MRMLGEENDYSRKEKNAVKIRQLNELTNQTTALTVYFVIIPQDLVGLSLIGRLNVQCMNPE